MLLIQRLIDLALRLLPGKGTDPASLEYRVRRSAGYAEAVISRAIDHEAAVAQDVAERAAKGIGAARLAQRALDERIRQLSKLTD